MLVHEIQQPDQEQLLMDGGFEASFKFPGIFRNFSKVNQRVIYEVI
ncbi:MAG: hypothetical protein ACRD22_02765 [Terriglobia bacterium]